MCIPWICCDVPWICIYVLYSYRPYNMIIPYYVYTMDMIHAGVLMYAYAYTTVCTM